MFLTGRSALPSLSIGRSEDRPYQKNPGAHAPGLFFNLNFRLKLTAPRAAQSDQPADPQQE